MSEDYREDAEPDRDLPDTTKLRRFALGVGVALLIYVLAGGEFGDSVHTVLTPIVHFERPSVLLGALLLASIYSSYRYWYYAIKLAPTRAKIREYFREPRSVYVFLGDEQFYKDSIATTGQTPFRVAVSHLDGKLPSGLSREQGMVITHGYDECKQVARKLEHYFPGLKTENISVTKENGTCWAYVSTTSHVTNWWCWVEGVELWLPIIVNGAALVACVGRESWPWISQAASSLWSLMFKA
jgi:hypothetical protein